MNENISDSDYQDSEFIERAKVESKNLTFQYQDWIRNLHNVDLFPYNVNEYYQSLKDRTAMPAYKELKRYSSNKQAGLTFWLRFKSFFFSEVKKELADRKKLADRIYEKERQVAINRYKDEEKKFYNRQKLQHEKIDERRQSFINGEVNEVQGYFKKVLYSDIYSTNFEDKYCIHVKDLEFDSESATLSLRYKIPTADEMLLCNRFEVNPEHNDIVPSFLDKKDAERMREDITQKVLARTFQLLYVSDSYSHLNNIIITGFFEYFDDSFGTIRRKDVIQLNMTREDFKQTDFCQVKISSLFTSRLKPKKSGGIYSKDATDIKELC